MHSPSALTFARNRIPYIKELRPICSGSLPATILMQQLEYWFERHPDGFYKFLEPCDHKSCRKGDTWVEELGFSADEFRNAFDKIGVRYRSRSKLLEESDPFKGKYYCCYHDRKNGLTFYFRNSDKVTSVLSELLDSYQQSVIAPERDIVLGTEASGEIGRVAQQSERLVFNQGKFEKPQLHNQTFPGSRTGDSPVTYIKETETKAEITQIAAAESEKAQMTKNKSQKQNDFAAAPFFEKKEQPLSLDSADRVIGETFTDKQKQLIRQKALSVSQFLGLGGQGLEQVEFRVSYLLKSKTNYTKAGTDFLWKINTIADALRKGTERLDHLEVEVSEPENTKRREIEQRLLKARQELYSVQAALKKPFNQANELLCKQFEEEARARQSIICQLERELKEVMLE